MQDNASEFTPQQIAYIDFIASGQTDSDGKRWAREQYAHEIARVDPATLWRWQQLPGFWEQVSSSSPKHIHRWVPNMNNAMIRKAINGDVNAYKVVMNQAGLLKSGEPEDDQPRTWVDLVRLAEKHRQELGQDQTPKV